MLHRVPILAYRLLALRKQGGLLLPCHALFPDQFSPQLAISVSFLESGSSALSPATKLKTHVEVYIHILQFTKKHLAINSPLNLSHCHQLRKHLTCKKLIFIEKLLWRTSPPPAQNQHILTHNTSESDFGGLI